MKFNGKLKTTQMTFQSRIWYAFTGNSNRPLNEKPPLLSNQCVFKEFHIGKFRGFSLFLPVGTYTSLAAQCNKCFPPQLFLHCFGVHNLLFLAKYSSMYLLFSFLFFWCCVQRTYNAYVVTVYKKKRDRYTIGMSLVQQEWLDAQNANKWICCSKLWD